MARAISSKRLKRNAPNRARGCAHEMGRKVQQKRRPQKAIAHFGRALDYTNGSRFGGGPLAAFTAAAGHPGLTSIPPTTVIGTGTGTGIGTGPGTIVGIAPPPASAQAHRSVAEQHAEYVKKARDLTAYNELGHQNQVRFLMRMRYYHVAAVIVGSTDERDFDGAHDHIGLEFHGTSPDL
ncbi:MAG: hypothetical protein EBZ77_01190 [Chitinophagia bacterium]|nr:hypothetical protein [Chitinophagia bacterium]